VCCDFFIDRNRGGRRDLAERETEFVIVVVGCVVVVVVVVVVSFEGCVAVEGNGAVLLLQIDGTVVTKRKFLMMTIVKTSTNTTTTTMS
jgi:hypothetical protein